MTGTRRQRLSAPVWAAKLSDDQGCQWHFDYVKGDFALRISPYAGRSVVAVITHVIPLAPGGRTPDDVTDAWLEERAEAWIAQRNADLASGMYGI